MYAFEWWCAYKTNSLRELSIGMLIDLPTSAANIVMQLIKKR